MNSKECIYDKIYEYDNLFQSWINAKKGKTKRRYVKRNRGLRSFSLRGINKVSDEFDDRQVRQVQRIAEQVLIGTPPSFPMKHWRHQALGNVDLTEMRDRIGEISEKLDHAIKSIRELINVLEVRGSERPEFIRADRMQEHEE